MRGTTWGVTLISGILAAIAWGEDVSAQQPRASLVGPQPSHYSPDDFYTARVGYRIQTGQAGFYRECNDDALRRYSPYIEWQPRRENCHPWPTWSPLATIGQDFKRKALRHAWGQGACGPQCTTANGPSVLSLLRLPPELKPRVASERAHRAHDLAR